MLAAIAVSTAAFAPSNAPLQRPLCPHTTSPVMETQEDLKVLAGKLNPVVGFYDPLRLAEAEFWDNTNEETIGWLRHAEIKHGRVAMAAFVGYCVQANGLKFPWAPFDAITATSPPDQWDALPYAAKMQIVLGVGFLEWWSEIRVDGTQHYMKGGKPGYFPPFSGAPDKLPHPIGLDLWDPFKFTKGLTAEEKSKKLIVEVNNGRLAMLGIMAFLAEAKVPGSVPALSGIVSPYSGEVMAPFFGDFGF
mmetsp:Transcript_32935/g.54412  ORF Transcript_32935/g.54412 Transcript_32935/m.54412 type:complete len:248 (-) Transcript_32935:289-1032(-)|eukprot:CAMPEP_0119308398 /NCGR_PEP_ID=MMETSP1333-20130426/10486_1 /TAXON_ID=418940 /ORGANISM="Scyphosphaera apsteinii, Strain RCC1455" /LENGTH=247 /DNA_ID=CAMNT_0007312151 /DNA_START=25 /DNA_END=768 /DNA_ORIENTATION=-